MTLAYETRDQEGLKSHLVSHSFLCLPELSAYVLGKHIPHDSLEIN